MSYLHVDVLNGSDLAIVRDTFPGDLQDVFVRIVFDADMIFETEDAVEGHQSPNWQNQSKTFQIAALEEEFCEQQQYEEFILHKPIDIFVYDRDIMSQSQALIGSKSLSLLDIFPCIDDLTSRNYTVELNDMRGYIEVFVNLEITVLHNEANAPSLETDLKTMENREAITTDSQQNQCHTVACQGGFNVAWTSSEALEKDLAEKERARIEVELQKQKDIAEMEKKLQDEKMRKRQQEEVNRRDSAAVTIQKTIRGQSDRKKYWQLKQRHEDDMKVKEKKRKTSERIRLRAEERRKYEMVKFSKAKNLDQKIIAFGSTELSKDLANIRIQELEECTMLGLQSKLAELNEQRKYQLQNLKKRRKQKIAKQETAYQCKASDRIDPDLLKAIKAVYK